MPSPTGPMTAATIHAGDQVGAGTYVDIGGDLIWHFVGGDPAGTPTVLLHGAFASASTWGPQIAGFIDAGLHVFVPERSGHGHSPDVAGPWAIDAMAAQIVGYLETVVGQPANLVGWADGSVLALLIARDRPDLVSRVVMTCNYLNAEGRDAPEFFAALTGREAGLVEFLRGAYDTESPDGPEHFDAIYAKTEQFLLNGPDFAVAEFASVQAPVLVVAADRGVVRLEQSLALARTLPRGRLAVLPGTHILPVESPELFNPLVLSFLMSDPPTQWVL
ncbi:alpha/beta fold hydrolase [Gordonia sp. DT30]|uniref:alpha/beta fold hydrolase n=1 Tax=unclassified Gordonia (in: high G+C Gram-positive bacteria) TaxID=2657482 RepID=UPI003CEEACFA